MSASFRPAPASKPVQMPWRWEQSAAPAGGGKAGLIAGVALLVAALAVAALSFLDTGISARVAARLKGGTASPAPAESGEPTSPPPTPGGAP